jgi:hypothetical protein
MYGIVQLRCLSLCDYEGDEQEQADSKESFRRRKSQKTI